MKQLMGLIYLLGLLLSIHLLGFTSQNPYTAAEALRVANKQFQNQLISLEEAIDHYYHTAELFNDSKATIDDLRAAHLQARLTFKGAEFLLEYNDRQSVKKYLNGPPLPSVEPKVPEIRVIEAVGLQVLDELVFGNTPKEERAEILDLVQQLKHEYAEVKKYQYRQPLQHRFIFESARLELNRIFTLGLTGFDTPGSVNAIYEAQVSFKAIANAIRAYLPLIEEKDKALAKQVDQLFNTGTHYLDKHIDFETFNRLEFLKLVINPLFAQLLHAQKALEIEIENTLETRPMAINLMAENLFSEDLLDVQYFSNVGDTPNFKKRADLGKLLFFDPILSSTNTRSCSSCHHPDKAFTDGMDRSIAIDGESKIKRNAPSLINAVYAEHYFYDLREPQLERQIKHVVRDSKEFNTDFLEIIEKLQHSETYRKLFAEAYPEYPQYQLSKWSVSNALACYIIELRSFDSPVDQYIRNEIEEIPLSVERGFNLFMGKASCGTCHFAPTFSGTVPPYYLENETEVLGVPATTDTLNLSLDTDQGRYTSGKPEDEAPFYRHSFKTVSVRNTALTAPYMHNGIYNSLEEVIDFYNKGGGVGMGIEVPYQTLPDTPLDLSESEISDLISFMEALTDTTGMTSVPRKLPDFEGKPTWNNRTVGGDY